MYTQANVDIHGDIINWIMKRKRTDGLPVLDTAEALRVQLRSAIATYESAEIAILFLIPEFNFDMATLEDVLKGELMISYSVCLI